jgi:hypothetical protein
MELHRQQFLAEPMKLVMNSLPKNGLTTQVESERN